MDRRGSTPIMDFESNTSTDRSLLLRTCGAATEMHRATQRRLVRSLGPSTPR